MKFKLLLPALLSISGACLAMEPCPVVAMDRPPHQPQQALSTVYPDDICLKCHTQSHKFPSAQRCITDCCGHFICSLDAQEILKSSSDQQEIKHNIKEEIAQLRMSLTPEQRKQMYKIAKPKTENPGLCLNCKKKLRVDLNRAVFLKNRTERKPIISCIDVQNNQFELDPELSAALLKCEALQMYEDPLNASQGHKQVLDFSSIQNKNYLQKSFIMMVARLIKDPVRWTDHIPYNLELFECAHYLGAPHNILYLIANQLWPLMQKDLQDNDHIKEYKKYVRNLAQPYFSCPKYLKEYHQSRPSRALALPSLRGDLSWFNLASASNGPWFQDSSNNWYKLYPFCTLEGIETFTERCGLINLSGHRIERITDIVIAHIDPKYNNENNIDINFDGNPITHIEESFFKAVTKRRERGDKVSLSILNTRLTVQDKQMYKKKFYNATHTLTQRYTSNFKFKSFAIGAGFLGTALAIECLSQKNPDLINTSSIICSGILGAVCAGGLTWAATDSETLSVCIGSVLGIAAAGECIQLIKNHPGRCTLPTHLLAAPLSAACSTAIARYAAFALAKSSHPHINSGGWETDKLVWKNDYSINI